MTLLKLATVLAIISFSGPLVWAFVGSYARYEEALNRAANQAQENFFQLFDADFIVSATAFTIGVITFFGVTELNRSSEDGRVFRGASLRTAIASSLVLSYLFIVCFTAFVRSSLEVGSVTKEFVQSFSHVISVTVAFYFSASAATQIFGKRKENEDASRPDEKK